MAGLGAPLEKRRLEKYLGRPRERAEETGGKGGKIAYNELGNGAQLPGPLEQPRGLGAFSDDAAERLGEGSGCLPPPFFYRHNRGFLSLT